MEKVLIEGGRRIGYAKLSNEEALRSAIADGLDVYTQLNRVYFRVTLGTDDKLLYTALTQKPNGL